MSISKFISDPKQIPKMLLLVLVLVGSCVSTYYLFAFKVDKFGLYYRDSDQFNLSIGVGILVIAWFVKNWKKL